MSRRQPTNVAAEPVAGCYTCRDLIAVNGDPSSDAVLVLAVARHDQGALAELYRRHGGSLYCAALRVLSVRTLAEEVVQDIFIRLWRTPERFDPGRGSLRSYLLAQCHGRAVDVVRSETARRRREWGEANTVKVQYVFEDDVLDVVSGQKLREAVATLSQKEREAISLAYFGGHSYVDVASILGVPEGTVKSRIRSGLARLRTAVVQAGVDPRVANSTLQTTACGNAATSEHPQTTLAGR